MSDGAGSDSTDAGAQGASGTGASPSGASPHPTAELATRGRWGIVWLVPLLAAAMAVYLGWEAWGGQRATIQVSFEDGHGLRVGNTLRHRGIVAGEVTDVRHGPGLTDILVDIALEPDAADLARVGSRFWIAQPRFGWAGISGLDTLVGDSYVIVIPGDGAAQRTFVGLDEPPIRDALAPGLDITLQATRRGSAGPGSPVSYRGMQVGSVLSVSLASDGRSVDLAVRIRKEYAGLVTPGTRFWETSGLGLDLGITGASLHLASLESLVRGGVSLATPPDDADAERVSTGHRFTLHPKPEGDWLDWRPPVAVGHSLLPAGAAVPSPLRAAQSWKEGRLWSLLTQDEQRDGWVLVVPGALLGPADLLQPADDAREDSARLELAGHGLPLAGRVDEPAPGLAVRPLPDDVVLAPWPRSRQRAPDAPEDCLLVAEPGAPPLSLAPGALEAGPDGWTIDPALPVDKRWHGAPVLSRRDGQLIGLVLADDNGARVVPLPSPLP